MSLENIQLLDNEPMIIQSLKEILHKFILDRVIN